MATSGDITFQGELNTIPAGSALVLKVNRAITHDQAERIACHCRAALGDAQRVLVIGPEVTPVAFVDGEPRWSRVFNHKNTGRASVYDVDTKERLGHVMSVDIDTGEVVRAHFPWRVVGDEVATYTERYRSIHPIYGGERVPSLFHCYDRQG